MLKLLKENWADYTIQLFLVMLGIIIPFLIAKLIENSKDKELGKKYTEMLVSDLNEDLKLLEYNLKNIDQERKTLISFIEKVKDAGKIEESALKGVVDIIVKYYHFIPSTSTYNDLESTGNMKLVSDLKGRTTLFSYYRLSKLITKMEEAYEKETEGFLKPSILKHFPVRRLKQYEFAFGNNSKFPINLEEINNDVNFDNVLLIKTDLLNNLRIMYENLIKLNRDVVTNLTK